MKFQKKKRQKVDLKNPQKTLQKTHKKTHQKVMDLLQKNSEKFKKCC